MDYLVEYKIGGLDGIEFLQPLGLMENQGLIYLILLHLLYYGRFMFFSKEGSQKVNFYLSF